MRNKSIDYLKCIATLLVINTHIKAMFPSGFGVLAFGGYFANSIFFFASGFCLTNVSMVFPKWYWKRFIRIYTPYLIILPFLFFAGELAGLNWVNIVMPFRKYHFIPTILFLYIVYYFLTIIHQKTKISYGIQIAAFSVVAVTYFVFFFDKKGSSVIEHFTLIETISYLIPMLLGGLAKEGKWIRNRFIGFSLVAVTFLAYVYQIYYPFTGYLKILQPCIGLLFSYGLGCVALSFEDKLPRLKIVEFISSITLESYLVQFVCLDAYKNIGFPTNIVFHVISTLAVAYCLHKVSSIIVKQLTFKDKPRIAA